MQIDRTTVPGKGVLHQLVTRAGGRLCLLVDAHSTRHVLLYDESDRDVPARSIVLEPDEADQLAEILHSRPITDRLAAVERQVGELMRERGR
ncbi:hypothetical protein [Rhodococcus sp. WAY2]|uniref:hypothetical protein n=1 Tax=Rhodococcus sp. WAY2 TaxID=2663121 RepID=UPI001356B8B0|nr:hypothetical protein [Rhodococcus sp. WAY2]